MHKTKTPEAPPHWQTINLTKGKKHKRATATLFALFYLTHIPGVRSQERNAEVILAYFTFNYKSLAMQQQNSKERKTNIHNIHLTIEQNHTTKESYEHEFYYTKKRTNIHRKRKRAKWKPRKHYKLGKRCRTKTKLT